MVQPASDGRLPDVVVAETIMTPRMSPTESPPETLTETVTSPDGAGVEFDALMVMITVDGLS